MQRSNGARASCATTAVRSRSCTAAARSASSNGRCSATNVLNGLAALAPCAAVGVDVAGILPALARFRSVKRRMEVVGTHAGITVYDDFAHHPTAIATTQPGCAKVGDARIVVAMGPQQFDAPGRDADALAPSRTSPTRWCSRAAGIALGCRQGDRGDPRRRAGGGRCRCAGGPLAALARAGDHVVFMSNGGFDGAPRRSSPPCGMAESRSLPLFPLRTVLVPGALDLTGSSSVATSTWSATAGGRAAASACLLVDGDEVGAHRPRLPRTAPRR